MSEKDVILLVEDDPDDQLLIIRGLKKSKVANRIVVAKDGEEALAMLFGKPLSSGPVERVYPVVVVLDIKLPKIGGLQVLEEIRKNKETALLPVVILTSSREEQDVMRGYALGVNSYIRKPVKFEEFIDAVAKVGLYWMMLNENPPNNP